MLSPRRVKSTPTVVLYELRLIRPNTRSEKLARMFEGVVKTWRGVSRWYLQTHTSPRGEAVLQVVGERHAQAARIDNLYAAWRRSVAKALQISKETVLKRASWSAVGHENYLLDAHIMHETFDGASAKLWAEIGGAADASRCSFAEPSMPPPQMHPPLPQQRERLATPTSKDFAQLPSSAPRVGTTLSHLPKTVVLTG